MQGIDISNYQGDIDWARCAPRHAIRFIEATEGGDLSTRFSQLVGRQRAGIPRGAYHLVFWCRPAREQAVWFILSVPRSRAFPPVSTSNGTRVALLPEKPDEARLEKIKNMLEVIEPYRKRPVIYTDITFHREVLEGELEATISGSARSSRAARDLPQPALAVLAVHHHRLRVRHRKASRSQCVQRHAGGLAPGPAAAGAKDVCAHGLSWPG